MSSKQKRSEKAYLYQKQFKYLENNKAQDLGEYSKCSVVNLFTKSLRVS